MTNRRPEGWNATLITVAFVLAAAASAAIRIVTPPLLWSDLIPTSLPLEAAAAAASCLIGAAVVGRTPEVLVRGRLLVAGAACLALGELLDASVAALGPGVRAALFRSETSSLLESLRFLEALAVAAAGFGAVGPTLIAVGLSRAVPVDSSAGRRLGTAVAVLAALAILQGGADLGRVLASSSGAGLSTTPATIAAIGIAKVLGWAWLAVVGVRAARSRVGPVRAWWVLAAGALVPVVAVWLNPLIAILSPTPELNVLSLKPVTQLLGAGLLIAAFGSGLAAPADPDVGRADSGRKEG